jgi:hypothetical protein
MGIPGKALCRWDSAVLAVLALAGVHVQVMAAR